jgi:hypothetical protein
MLVIRLDHRDRMPSLYFITWLVYLVTLIYIKIDL